MQLSRSKKGMVQPAQCVQDGVPATSGLPQDEGYTGQPDKPGMVLDVQRGKEGTGRGVQDDARKGTEERMGYQILQDPVLPQLR